MKLLTLKTQEWFLWAILYGSLPFLTYMHTQTHTEWCPGIHLQHIVSVCIQRCLSQLYNENTVRATGFSIQLSVCNPPLFLTCLEQTQSFQAPVLLHKLTTWQSHSVFSMLG